MRTAVIAQHGPFDGVEIADVSEPHTRPGEARIRVGAASGNPIGWKARVDGLAEGRTNRTLVAAAMSGGAA